MQPVCLRFQLIKELLEAIKTQPLLWFGEPYLHISLHFIDKGVKLYAKYYLEQVIVGNFFAHVFSTFRNNPNCFQQDSAPAHKARIVQ